MQTEISNGVLSVSVKSFGAELSSIRRDDLGIEYLWQGDPAYWSGQSPLLFPIVGGLADGNYLYKGKEYTLPKHGFARRSEFTLAEKGQNFVSYQLRSTQETLQDYPFEFVLTVKYTLNENAIEISYCVENKSEDTMYFSIGAHPAFNCPTEKGLAYSNYFLEFNKNETADRWYLKNGVRSKKQENYLSDQKRILLTDELFKDDALIFSGLASNEVTLRSELSQRYVQVSFDGFTYLGLWAKQNADFVCIEPWYGVDDIDGFAGELKNKEGICSIEPQTKFNCRYIIRCG